MGRLVWSREVPPRKTAVRPRRRRCRQRLRGRTLSDDDVAAGVAALGGGVGVERVAPVPALRWAGTRPELPELEADRFDRVLDRVWRRVSYSSITQASHDQTVSSEPDEHVIGDEEPVASFAPAGAGDADRGLAAVPLLLV